MYFEIASMSVSVFGHNFSLLQNVAEKLLKPPLVQYLIINPTALPQVDNDILLMMGLTYQTLLDITKCKKNSEQW